MGKRRNEPKKKIVLDFSNEAVGEPILKAVDDAITSAGTVKKQIAVEIDGTTYYLHAYTTGS